MAKKADNSTVQWWGLTVRGIVAILFGVAAVFWPGLTLATLVYLVGGFIMAGGLVGIVESVVSVGHHRAWFLHLLLAFAEVAVGLYLLRHPLVTFTTFILVIGITLIARGVIEVVSALAEDGATATGRTLTIVSGIAAFLVGIIVLFQPVASGVAFVWLLGLYALITGPLMIALSLDLKSELFK